MLLSNRKAVTVHGLSGNIGFWFLFSGQTKTHFEV
jgi:hypothetical protein